MSSHQTSNFLNEICLSLVCFFFPFLLTFKSLYLCASTQSDLFFTCVFQKKLYFTLLYPSLPAFSNLILFVLSYAFDTFLLYFVILSGCFYQFNSNCSCASITFTDCSRTRFVLNLLFRAVR